MVGYIVIAIGLIFMGFGVIGVLQPKRDFYYRILVACKIDTVGIITFCVGLGIRHGISFFTGKIFLLLIIILVLNPLVAHMIVRSAHSAGYIPLNETEEGEVK